ncbi:glycosyltransferase family 4 protein [Arthrospira platensis BEA 1257B]
MSYLLEACAILQQQGETNYQLWVVGDGHQRPELETFCQQNQLTNYVRWFGRVEYHQLATYFTQADVFVLPTLEDTWGMVVLEAMVLGRPVLCSELAGASELITDGENGYCFHPQQPEYLAELMARFIQNPELAKLMGMRSQKLMDNYTPEAAANFLNQVTSFIFPNY